MNISTTAVKNVREHLVDAMNALTIPAPRVVREVSDLYVADYDGEDLAGQLSQAIADAIDACHALAHHLGMTDRELYTVTTTEGATK